MKEVQNLISTNGAVPVWSDTDGQYYVEYINGGVTYKIWVEDATSLEEKLKVMQSNQLAGGASGSLVWRIRRSGIPLSNTSTSRSNPRGS